MSAEKPVCLQLKIGKCSGCNVLSLIANKARWSGIAPEQAAKEISKVYCPPNVRPQHELIKNTLASSGMGQTQYENLDFNCNGVVTPGRKLHGRY